jgi:hypothetical protein
MKRERLPNGDAPNFDYRSQGIQLLSGTGSRYIGRETYPSPEAHYACWTSLFLVSAFS